MGGFVSAWLVGIGIVIYRQYKIESLQAESGSLIAPNHKPSPPGPGTLLAASGAFIILALLAEAPQARQLAVLTAWGLDIAGFISVASPNSTIPEQQAGEWPPEIAPNNVIFPTGVITTTSAQTTPATGTGSTTPPGTTLV
jgi:hypothetical protein